MNALMNVLLYCKLTRYIVSITNLAPAAEPKYHMASTAWCSARYLVTWSLAPDRMFTTPPGRSLVSNICTREDREV